MNISYTLPLSRGWDQMKIALFKPFDLNKWIRIGFTAWLAGLADCSGGSGGGNQAGKGKPDWDEFFSFPETTVDWLQSHPGWYALIVAGIVLLVALITVFIWLSSRGKFMFLHNVVNQKNDISIPWREYKKEGDSLFKWRFAFLWITIIVMVLFFKSSFLKAKELYYGSFQDMEIFREIAWMVFIFIALFIVVGYISLFLNDFVVPLMFKHRLSASWGWYRFLPILGRYLFVFIGYGLFVFALLVAVVFAVIIFGVFTCFVGLLLLAIPFIGSVVLLPVSYTFRAFSVEFLAQFGDDFNLLPAATDQA
jgi:hypothetical protein